jgi:hypothetical protein
LVDQSKLLVRELLHLLKLLVEVGELLAITGDVGVAFYAYQVAGLIACLMLLVCF